jgi:septum formation protein
MPTSPALILASTSPYRRELLTRLELPFEVAAPDFDERADEERLFPALGPAEYALHLARGKAHSLVSAYPSAWILAADQLAVLDEDPPKLLHKPGDPDTAVAQLLRLAGRTHHLITGVVLLHAPTGARREALDRHALTMRPFGAAEARAYVERHRPLDCAGAYRIEDAGIKLFKKIEGEDFSGIIGLPLLAVAALLREAELLPAP